jgi:hypothetical protein
MGSARFHALKSPVSRSLFGVFNVGLRKPLSVRPDKACHARPEWPTKHAPNTLSFHGPKIDPNSALYSSLTRQDDRDLQRQENKSHSTECIVGRVGLLPSIRFQFFRCGLLRPARQSLKVRREIAPGPRCRAAKTLPIMVDIERVRCGARHHFHKNSKSSKPARQRLTTFFDVGRDRSHAFHHINDRSYRSGRKN